MRLNPFSKHITWRDRGLDSLIGAVGVLALAPFHVWPMMLVSLAAFYVRLFTRTTPSAGFSTGFWTGFGYFSVGMIWIAQAFFERGASYIPLIIPLVLGLFILLALFWGAAGAILIRANLKPGWRAPAFVSALGLAEFTRGHLFGGFPWNLHGYAFDAGTSLSQIASVIGIYGLSLLVILIGALAGQAYLSRSKTSALLATLLLVGNFGFGAWRLSGAEIDYIETTRVRLVHTPFRQSEMMDRDKSITLTNRFFENTLSADLDGITHIIWPEGAVRGLAMENRQFLSVFPNSLKETENALPYFLFSSIREQWRPNADGTTEEFYYNSAVIAGFPDGAPAILAFADKKRLVPFGEYVPFSEQFSKIGLEAIAASFTPAPDKAVSAFPGLPPVSVQICYEVIFSGLTEGEPELILNQSNDAWFGQWHGPAQHAAIARMRAVEEGVPILRSAANGWSGTIDSYGRWIERMGPKDNGYLDVALPRSINPTVFSSLTNVIILLIILSTGLSTIVAGRLTSRGVKPNGMLSVGGQRTSSHA
jgi:apolipoprotein N-acyltransferase